MVIRLLLRLPLVFLLLLLCVATWVVVLHGRQAPEPFLQPVTAKE